MKKGEFGFSKIRKSQKALRFTFCSLKKRKNGSAFQLQPFESWMPSSLGGVRSPMQKGSTSRERGIRDIVSFDPDLDEVPWLRRIASAEALRRKPG